MKAGNTSVSRHRRITFMNIIIALLVIINAAAIIGLYENDYSDRLYSANTIMKYISGNEYGKAAYYADMDAVISEDYAEYKGDDKQLNESIAAADYYRMMLRKRIYENKGDNDGARRMQICADKAQAAMGSLSPVQEKIDQMLGVQ